MGERGIKNRNIVYYVSRQYMRVNKNRRFASYIEITFMIVLMTCVFVGKDIAMNYMQEAASLVQGKWDVRSYSPNYFTWMNISVSRGRLPENSHELIVSKTAAERRNYDIYNIAINYHSGSSCFRFTGWELENCQYRFVHMYYYFANV